MTETKSETKNETPSRPTLGGRLWRAAEMLGTLSFLAMLGSAGLTLLERRGGRAQRVELKERMRLADLHDAGESSGPCVRDPAGTCRNELHYPSVHGDNLYPDCAKAHTGAECVKQHHRHPMSDENEDLEAMAARLPPEGVGLILPEDDRDAAPESLGLRVEELPRVAHAPGADAAPDLVQPGSAPTCGGESESGPES